MSRSSSSPTGALERDGCLEACRRLRELVDRVVERSPDAYTAIGPHARHCVDHFSCLLRGLELGRVDYDARRRDGGLERSASRLVAALDGIERRLRDLAENVLTGTIDVLQVAAPGAPPAAAPSSVRRELAFLSSHTIHHLAIMGALAAQRGIEIPESLLLAFSTEAYRRAVTPG